MTTNTATLLEILDSDDEKLRTNRDQFSEGEAKGPIARDTLTVGDRRIPRLVGEFWTSGQRQASSIHEISYRACFKPQLPHYFIRRFTSAGDLVYDPFGGRGTTGIEAALMGRRLAANDVNPLSEILTRPRLSPPTPLAVAERLGRICYQKGKKAEIDLSMFYDPDTESEIVSLREYLHEQRAGGREDSLDQWIRMVATNRLTGHSPGFFSVYTFPPNQAVSQESQLKINERRNQKPEYRDTKKIIVNKTASLVAKLSGEQRRNLAGALETALFLTGDARHTPEIATGSVQLTVTSPPFLDIVEYATDNWLRCWFNWVNSVEVSAKITMSRTTSDWCEVMGVVFKELERVTRPSGWVAFEVGEIRNGKLKLEEHIVPLGLRVDLNCEAVLINTQIFTKTSNIWGISNNEAGTNTNRIVLFRKL